MSDDSGEPPLTRPGRMHGHADERFAALRDAFASGIESGRELGASLCVTVDDEPLVDLWGGWASGDDDAAEWGPDTITNVWSISKTATALAALTLVDRGLLALDAPVASVWPEFGAAGKSHITLRQVLRHQAGVVGWDPPFRADDMLDLEAASAVLAAQEPWFTPGGQPGYAANSYGHLIDPLVRRTDGRSLGAFVADELAGPLGADFWLGLPESEEGRVSLVVPPPKTPMKPERRASPGSVSARAFTGPNVDARKSHSRAWRAAGNGAAGGTANARAVVRLNQLVAQGGVVDGTRLLSPELARLLFDEPISGDDLVLRLPVHWCLGFARPHPVSTPWLPQGDDERITFWGGWGGSLVICDARRRMTFSYVMNKMSASVIGSARSHAYVRALYEATV